MGGNLEEAPCRRRLKPSPGPGPERPSPGPDIRSLRPGSRDLAVTRSGDPTARNRVPISPGPATGAARHAAPGGVMRGQEGERSDSEEQREERIRKRAYGLWEADGRPDGRESEFWERAKGNRSAWRPAPAPGCCRNPMTHPSPTDGGVEEAEIQENYGEIPGRLTDQGDRHRDNLAQTAAGAIAQSEAPLAAGWPAAAGHRLARRRPSRLTAGGLSPAVRLPASACGSPRGTPPPCSATSSAVCVQDRGRRRAG